MSDSILCPKCHFANPPGTSFCAKCGVSITPTQEKGADPFVGTFVGERFLVKRKLGEGGMGVVYEAEQTAIDRKVALKVLHPHLTDEDLYLRFRNEAAACSRLDHPNIITVYDFGRTDVGSLYIAMEFISGRDLDSVVEEARPLAWQRCCHIASQICSALRNAHENGIIHRDMKPENVMLCQRDDDPDFVKVLDFGIAKIAEDGGDQRKALTRTGMVFGTPQYMSPEQVRGEKIDARSDIYSVGIILYYMLTGKLPFTADTPMGLLTKHLMDTPAPFREMNNEVDVPGQMERLVMKAMAKEPADRPQTMKDFRDELDALVGIVHSGKTTVAGAMPETMSKTGATQPMTATGEYGDAETRSYDTSEAVQQGIRGQSRVPLWVGVALLLIVGGSAAFVALTRGDASGGASDNGAVADRKRQDNNEEGIGVAPVLDTAQEVDSAHRHAESEEVPGADTALDTDDDSGAEPVSVDSEGDRETTTENATGSTQAGSTGNTGGKKPVPGGDPSDGAGQGAKPSAQGVDRCMLSARGKDGASLIQDSLRKRQAAIMNCLKGGQDVITIDVSVKKGDTRVAGTVPREGGGEATCLAGVVKRLVLTPAPSADGKGTVQLRLKRRGTVIESCMGVVKL